MNSSMTSNTKKNIALFQS